MIKLNDKKTYDKNQVTKNIWQKTYDNKTNHRLKDDIKRMRKDIRKENKETKKQRNKETKKQRNKETKKQRNKEN